MSRGIVTRSSFRLPPRLTVFIQLGGVSPWSAGLCGGMHGGEGQHLGLYSRAVILHFYPVCLDLRLPLVRYVDNFALYTLGVVDCQLPRPLGLSTPIHARMHANTAGKCQCRCELKLANS